jgi:hypothetical protein
MASTPTALPTAATLQVPSIMTKFGALTPDVIQQLQSAFQMDYRTDIILTAAQMITLNTGAITLVAAPGLGLMICPETIIIRQLCVTTALSDGGGGAVSFAVGTMSAALAANTVFTQPTNGQRAQQVFDFSATSTAANPPTNENAPLTITKATGNFTGGGTSTTHITIFYTIETGT